MGLLSWSFHRGDHSCQISCPKSLSLCESCRSLTSHTWPVAFHQLLHLGVWLQLNTLAWYLLILVKVISHFHLHIFYLDHISKANISVVERIINHPQIINISKPAIGRVIKLSDLLKKIHEVLGNLKSDLFEIRPGPSKQNEGQHLPSTVLE